MTTPTLTTFLLARLAEDEKRAREDGADAMVGWRWKHYPREAYEEIQSLTIEHSRRRGGDVEAKRRIVELHGANEPYHVDPCDAHDPVTLMSEPCDTLRALALPYADHPDYRDEWKP